MSNNDNTPLNPAPGGDNNLAAAPKKESKPAWRWITPTLAGVAILVIGLFGGVIIGQQTATTARGQFGNGAFSQNGQTRIPGSGANGTGIRAGGGFTSGTIASISGDSVTITLANGTTVTVNTTSTTTVTKAATITLSDLAVGDRVSVVGTKTGTVVTAKSISEGGLFGGFGGGQPSGSGQ